MPGQATDERSRPPEPLFHFLRNRCSTSSGFRVPLPPEYPPGKDRFRRGDRRPRAHRVNAKRQRTDQQRRQDRRPLQPGGSRAPADQAGRELKQGVIAMGPVQIGEDAVVDEQVFIRNAKVGTQRHVPAGVRINGYCPEQIDHGDNEAAGRIDPSSTGTNRPCCAWTDRAPSPRPSGGAASSWRTRPKTGESSFTRGRAGWTSRSAPGATRGGEITMQAAHYAARAACCSRETRRASTRSWHRRWERLS